MKKPRHTRWILWLCVLLAASGAAWSLRPQAIVASTGLVTRGTLTATVSAEGRTRVKDLYVISAPVDGRLERIVVHPGDAVARSAAVAEIRPAVSRPLDARALAEARGAVLVAGAAVARAEAAEREAQVEQTHAESLLATTRELAQRGAAPPNDLEHRSHEAEMRHAAADAATAAAQIARGELARARAVVSPMRDAGSNTIIPSPIAGRILRVLRESAGPIAAGTPLVELGDVSSLEVRADFLSSDAANVRPGAPATITGWGGARPLAARVRRVDPAAFTKISALGLEEQRVPVVLDLDEPPPPGLGHDYRVDAAVVIWTGQDVLRVPSSALFRASNRWAVFAVRDGRARTALVDVGATDGSSSVVTGGVQEGEIVLLQPSDAIEEGTRIRSQSGP